MGETLLKDGKSSLDIDAEKKLIEEKLNGLRSNNNSEQAITSTMKELGILRTIDGVIGGYAKGKVQCLPCDPDTIFDTIPADMVINSILVAIVARANKSSSKIIYHIGSSSKNPIKFSEMQDYALQYFTKNPLTDKRGNSIKYKRIITFDTTGKFRKYMMTRYVLPLKVLKLINILTFEYYKDLYVTSKRKTEAVIRIADLYESYMYFKGIFDDTNSENLRMEVRNMGLVVEDEDKGFNFDPKTIDWEYYFINVHFPGLVNHVISKRPDRILH